MRSTEPHNDARLRRLEHDFLGACEVPASALFGIHTVRAMRNFELGGRRLSDQPTLVEALGVVKIATARANKELGTVDPERADAIIGAAQELREGSLDSSLQVGMVAGGGGTSIHMNVNEVLANRAGQLLGHPAGSYHVHPNDHVNRSQSTNDVIPTAAGIAVYLAGQTCLSRLDHLRQALIEQAERHQGWDHLGRTCLQDALPVPISAVHESQAAALARAARGLSDSLAALLEVPLGGTAVGTGAGAPPGFRDVAVARLAEETGLPISAADNPFEGLASLEPLVSVADRMSAAARTCARTAADLRLLASGPVGGIAEVDLPPVQAGSSAMPGKVNPVIPELVLQMSFRLAGSAHTVQLAAGAGELEVSPMAPVAIDELLTGLQMLGRTAQIFADRCIAGLSWSRDAVQANLRGSLAAAMQNVQNDGYDSAAQSYYEDSRQRARLVALPAHRFPAGWEVER
ncbi:lyase family protein [Kribbella sp. NPDC059898]|uniref:lyase family protein n=1 Tax=Kribbella sp. NPDC059898 TaxID=3346995 RepID=UPI0036523C3F